MGGQPDPPDRRSKADVTRPAAIDGRSPIDERPGHHDGWEEYASFIVSFDRRCVGEEERWQTRVWDAKGMTEMVKPGTAPGPWISFILEQARLPNLH